MKSSTKAVIASLALLFGASDLHIADWRVGMGFFSLVSDAEARVGRPATPGSVAGVARRTTRRVIRRGAYIGAIPAGCPYGSYYGYNLYYCGGSYYQKSGGGYVVVYF
ncbi:MULTISPECIES: hypothetical protein [Mesorhizobium]|uniref:Uncharacterized protein n=1 Tax=Mesorhizobium tianshanense TaxID=39844 RepID=A0A562PFV9_9HYPH|nr:MULTISPECIES: hypothetical protein [Mesorhizobium]TIO04487.1 MAG: hypothetical protein E5X88_31520 [Mesorhizobium sp.]TIO29306.1 MAG: hypothetical protein E5X89_31540 [Mesorhizobium sp.]TIP09900.1 MAG: hypothetical protein E5X73_24445 [Mesorhizobium sp.]TWI43324.1 hypothetical protein IQ26_00286 [Mesorhizobium tianshanense]GLS39419.1 hypothetical protein GCM10010869_50160 [Mesorhizobium tianshanense]